MASFSRTYRVYALPKQRSNPNKEDAIRNKIKALQHKKEDMGILQMMNGDSRMTVVPRAE